MLHVQINCLSIWQNIAFHMKTNLYHILEGIASHVCLFYLKGDSYSLEALLEHGHNTNITLKITLNMTVFMTKSINMFMWILIYLAVRCPPFCYILEYIFLQCSSCLVAFMLHIQLPLKHNFFPSMQFMKGSTPLSSCILFIFHIYRNYLLSVQFMS